MLNVYNPSLAALNHIAPSCDRPTWIRAGMAAKAAGITFNDFHEWCKNGINYKNENDCKSVWNSFDETGGITAATLFHMACENGWNDKHIVFDDATRCKNNSSPNDKKRVTANKRALEIWERCLPATLDHEYIKRKQGVPAGLRYYPSIEPELIINGKNVAGYLVVPCSIDDEIQTLQFISPGEGEKLNLSGASFDDGYFVVGEIKEVIYVGEGLGQSWAVNKATGHGAIVCFGAGRMLKVATLLRIKYPNSRLIIVPDRGIEKMAADIATKISAQWIELPHDKPKNYDVNDYAKEHGYIALATLLADTKIPELRYKPLSLDEIYNSPPMQWIVKGIIPKVGLAALYGPSGSGKSFLLLDLALTIATGGNFWFGHRINPVPVTYVCLEGESGLSKRVKAWFTYTNKAFSRSIRFITQPFNLLSDDVDELVNAIVREGHTNGMVILDTLNRATPGADENSPVDMGKIISSSSKLQRLMGGIVLLAHHTGKDEAKKLRGHSSLPAALDGAIEVTKNGAGRLWTVAKSKDDKDGDTYAFKLEVINLGTDEDGDAISSCVVDFDTNNAANELKKALPPKAGNQKIVWDSLNRLLAVSKEFGKSKAPVGRSCIRLDDAVSQLHGCLACELKRQTERIRSAITGLIGRGLLALNEGWLWMV